MAPSESPRRGIRVLGLGALACLGCCAGPVLAFLGGLSIAGVASTAIIGSVGLVVAVAAAGGYLTVRRRRTSACGITVADPVPVELSTHAREGSR